MTFSVGSLRLAAAIAVFAATVPLFAGGGGFGGGYGGYGGGGYGGYGGGYGGRNGFAGGFNSDALRQNLLANVQYEVGFTDEEWSVIEPMLWKVVALQAESGTGALGQTVNRVRGRGGAGGAGGFDVNSLIAQAVNNGNPVPVLQLQQQLDDLLDDPTASDPQIYAKLAEYRAARDRVLSDLQAAQTDLQSVLTLRQEGWLLELGYLE